MAADGSSARASAALTVTDAISSRTKSHWQVPPTRPRKPRSSRLVARRKCPLTMARLVAGATIPGTRAAAAAGGTASTTQSPGATATGSPPKSSPATRSDSKRKDRSRWLNRAGQALRPRKASAGSMKLSFRLLRATSGRQAASPRPNVWAIMGHIRLAAPSSALVLRTATARGSQNRLKRAPSVPRHAATVVSRPAQARRSPRR